MKLTLNQKEEIKRLLEEKILTYQEIANKFNVSKQLINQYNKKYQFNRKTKETKKERQLKAFIQENKNLSRNEISKQIRIGINYITELKRKKNIEIKYARAPSFKSEINKQVHELREKGLSYGKIAKELNISVMTAYRHVNRWEKLQ